MGRARSTTNVPPYKGVRNLRSTVQTDQVVQGGEIRGSGPGVVRDGAENGVKFSVRPSTDLRRVNFVTRKGNLGRAEIKDDLVATPPRQRRGERVVGSQTPRTIPRRECRWYMRTAECKYGDRCIFDHPPNVKRPDWNSEGYPLREDKKDCPHYIKHGWCGFGHTCEFHHPDPNIVDGRTYSAINVPSANTASGYTLYPMPPPMPSQGWFPPMSMPIQMTHYPYMSPSPFLTTPSNVELMPWFYPYPPMARFGYLPTQESHLMPSLPTVFGSNTSFVIDSYKEDEEEPTKDSLKDDEQSEYDEN